MRVAPLPRSNIGPCPLLSSLANIVLIFKSTQSSAEFGALQGPGAIAPQPDEADIEEFLSTIRDYPTPPREYFDIEAKV